MLNEDTGIFFTQSQHIEALKSITGFWIHRNLEISHILLNKMELYKMTLCYIYEHPRNLVGKEKIRVCNFAQEVTSSRGESFSQLKTLNHRYFQRNTGNEPILLKQTDKAQKKNKTERAREIICNSKWLSH